MRPVPPLPRRIGNVPVPQDDVSAATWDWAQRALPRQLFAHSVRSYCWGAAIAGHEGWRFDRRILWTAALIHDAGLRRLAANTMCFEVEGAELAGRFLARHGMPPGDVERVSIAIILHMQPSVTLADGVEAVLIDRATGLDVRGVDYELVAGIRDRVTAAFPRGAFDRHFLDAIRREAAARPGCQSARLLHGTKLADRMAVSPWAAVRS